MRMGFRRFLAPGVLALGAGLIACASIPDSSQFPTTGRSVTSNFAEGKFSNAQVTRKMSFLSSARSMWRIYTEKPSDSVPDKPIAIRHLTPDDLKNAPDHSLWRLGHSTLLIKLSGKYWLTDPVFVERASPLSFVGPKRFHAPPLARDDLPEIEAVILSHDHYDHMDRETVLAIEPRVKHFLAPLGVGDRLIDWGIPSGKVQQHDWWQETQIGPVKLVATPAQHFSGRSLSDRNSTLWASWVLVTPETRLFFSGDSGYFDGFKTIGDRFGPFDMTLLENGAYNQAWSDIHMMPEETVQAHFDLRGKQLVPIHNGTFDLALHVWTEPFERIVRLAKQQNVAISTPGMGERLDILNPAAGLAWWRSVDDQKQPIGDAAQAKDQFALQQ